MISYGEDYLYANEKLSGSVVTYLGEPVTITGVDSEDGNFYGRKVCIGTRVHAPLAELDLTPIVLGYANTPTQCSYLYRTPSRVWRQGVRDNVIQFIGGLRVRVDSASFYNMAKNVYPTVTSCVETIVNGEATSQAFSKDFAVQSKRGGFHLCHKGTVCGSVKVGDGLEISLDERYSYLQEIYEEQQNV